MEQFPSPDSGQQERRVQAFEEALYAGTNVSRQGPDGRTTWLPIEEVARSLSDAERQAAVARVAMRFLGEGLVGRLDDLSDRFPLAPELFTTDAAKEAALQGIAAEVHHRRGEGVIERIQRMCGLTDEEVKEVIVNRQK